MHRTQGSTVSWFRTHIETSVLRWLHARCTYCWVLLNHIGLMSWNFVELVVVVIRVQPLNIRQGLVSRTVDSTVASCPLLSCNNGGWGLIIQHASVHVSLWCSKSTIKLWVKVQMLHFETLMWFWAHNQHLRLSCARILTCIGRLFGCRSFISRQSINLL